MYLQYGWQRTDESTKMLTPGTNKREIKACAISKNRVPQMETYTVRVQTLYAPSDMKQSRSVLRLACVDFKYMRKSSYINMAKMIHHIACSARVTCCVINEEGGTHRYSGLSDCGQTGRAVDQRAQSKTKIHYAGCYHSLGAAPREKGRGSLPHKRQAHTHCEIKKKQQAERGEAEGGYHVLGGN